MKPRRAQFARGKRIEARREKAAAGPPKLVTIDKPIYGGAFLARVEGKAVFVPLTLPGEQARVRITDDWRGYASAEVDEIIASAPERIAPACGHFGVCGGCNYQHAGYVTQLALKQAILRETLERGGVRSPERISVLAVANEALSWGYRNRIRLAFDALGNPGYRGRRSHAVIPIAECTIAAPLLVKAGLIFGEVAKQFSPALLPAEVSLFCDAEETSLLVGAFTADIAKGDVEKFEQFARALAERIPVLKGVEFVDKGRAEGRAGDLDRVQFLRPVTQWGETSIAYSAAGFSYRVDNGAFFQVNRWLVDGLVEQVTAGYRGELAWDLFAGVGLFARKLAGSFGRVVAVESAPQATAALKENLRSTTGAAVRASTLDFLRSGGKCEKPDFIVVDPPRTGLGREITALLAGVAAPRLVYVSCDPATLARDLRALIATGYTMEKITLADLFPQTFHLETVVHLRRS
jgi:23S rRNA (uracil1939-C5)-methyltransferase